MDGEAAKTVQGKARGREAEKNDETDEHKNIKSGDSEADAK